MRQDEVGSSVVYVMLLYFVHISCSFIASLKSSLSVQCRSHAWSTHVSVFVSLSIRDDSGSSLQNEWKESVLKLEHFENILLSNLQNFWIHLCQSVTLSVMYVCPSTLSVRLSDLILYLSVSVYLFICTTQVVSCSTARDVSVITSVI